ncbi:MAG TPA: hypothetical protein VGD59_03025 [Acidisarcina sp.]
MSLAVATGLLLARRARWPAIWMMLATTSQPMKAQGPTIIHVTPTVIHDHVKRLGMNLGGQGFYDSQQILKNLVSRNPGFEGQQWQSILQCAQATANSCTDITPSSSWPDGFLDGGTYEFISGAAKGKTGTITHSTAIDKNSRAGVTIQFDKASNTPAAKDYVIVRKTMPGGAGVGWWVQLSRGGTFATEYKDLSPSSPGKQAAHITALEKDQGATIVSFFANSFIRLHGTYVLKFRAKGLGGNRTVLVGLRRVSKPVIFNKPVQLSTEWQDYTFNIDVNEEPDWNGNMALSLAAYGGEMLIDDVSFEAATSNGTAFRDEVVSALQRLQPGVLRYMDSGKNFGSSLDNMLAVADARERTGYNKCCTQAEDIPVGLHDFLVLCEKIKAEPWYAMQIGMTEQEARNLIEYLGGPPTTKYGAKRAALGHPAPWTTVFTTIHLEFGNEAWNQAFTGSSIGDPHAYGERAGVIFRAARSSPWYSAKNYDLIANGFAVAPSHNAKVLEAAEGADTIDVAPYLFNTFNDDSSEEAVFGSMFAQPEQMDSVDGGIDKTQAWIASQAKRPARLAVYETGMDTTQGSVSQASVDAAVPSIGAGIASIDHMLLMLRDLGVTVQNTFQLTGYRTGFLNRKTYDRSETTPVWGVVLDMGGASNRVRPSFLAQELANQAILPSMLQTSVSGDNPTWDQPLSTNDKIALKGAHELQTFAFTDGKRNTLILLNLSRTTAHAIRVSGPHAPLGDVTVKTLTAAKITDSNELAENVKIVSREEHEVAAEKTVFSLPPFSMTVLSSGSPAASPDRGTRKVQ